MYLICYSCYVTVAAHMLSNLSKIEFYFLQCWTLWAIKWRNSQGFCLGRSSFRISKLAGNLNWQDIFSLERSLLSSSRQVFCFFMNRRKHILGSHIVWDEKDVMQDALYYRFFSTKFLEEGESMNLSVDRIQMCATFHCLIPVENLLELLDFSLGIPFNIMGILPHFLSLTMKVKWISIFFRNNTMIIDKLVIIFIVNL